MLQRVVYSCKPTYLSRYLSTGGKIFKSAAISSVRQGEIVNMETKHMSVRHVPDNDDMKISFHHNGQLKDFNRKKNDSLEKTLQRIALKLQPKKKKAKKKKENTEEEKCDIICRILENDVEVSPQSTNLESFVDKRIVQINADRYLIHVNPPIVTKLVLQECIMAGFPLIPHVQFESASINDSKFTWYKSKKDFKDWTFVSDGFSYIPDISDTEFHLKCVCMAGNGSVTGPFYEEVISESPVSPGPGVCLFDQRHLLTPEYFPLNGHQFRMMTYNVLANVLADTDYARSTLFPHCPPYAIKSDYRRQLLFKELLGYHADLICLQEVSQHEYEHYLSNWMCSNGYTGFLKLKEGEMCEGEAFFYRTQRYHHVADLSTTITDALMDPSNADLAKKLTEVPDLLESLLTKKSVGQIHLLRQFHGDDGDYRLICVLNTHIYYKRHASVIRLFQIAILLNYIHEKLIQYEKEVSVIVSGDLNSLDHEPVLKYLIGDSLPRGHPVWAYSEHSNEEHLKLIEQLKCPFELNFLSKGYPFTSYVPHCKATLDYIYGDSHSLVTTNLIPMPPEEEIVAYVGVPCVVYPSDHLAVVVDLEFK